MIGPPLRNSSQMPIIAQRVPLQTDPFSSREANYQRRGLSAGERLRKIDACLRSP
jgi:hypothetical protein